MRKNPGIADGKNVSQVKLEVISCETDSKASLNEHESRQLSLVWLEFGHAFLESSHQI